MSLRRDRMNAIDFYNIFFNSPILSFSSDNDHHDDQVSTTTGSGACTNTEVIDATDNANSHTTFDELANPIMDKAKEIEANRKKHHKETFTFLSFVRLLIYYFCGKVNSGRKLITSAQSEDQNLNLEPVPRSTFFYAFNRFPAEWFKSLFVSMLSQIEYKSIPELDLLGQLYITDGSIFPVPLNVKWAEYKSNSRALKLHLSFHLNKMIPVDICVDTANSNERDALRSMLQKGITYIADRGYVCFTLLADIVDVEAFFVIRMYCNLAYTIVEPLSVDLPSTVKHIFQLVTDQKVKLNGAEGEDIYRLVTFWVGDEKYLILTNRFDLTTFQIILLYAYRWQVELIFRFLKHSCNGLHLLSTSQNGSQIHFYMLLCTALLQLHLKQKCLQQNQEQGSQTGDQVLGGPQIDQNQPLPEPLIPESQLQQEAPTASPTPSLSSPLICDKDEQQNGTKSKPTSYADSSGKITSDNCFDASQNQLSRSTEQSSAGNDGNADSADSADSADPAQSIKIAGLMIDPEQLAGSRGQTFLATIGSKLDRYWKISIHWLVKLRNYLHRSFTPDIMISLATDEP